MADLDEGRASAEEGADAPVEAPRPTVVVERVLVASDELHGPTFVAHEQEHEVTRGASLVVVPVGDERVEHEVTLRAARRDARVRLAQCVVTLVRAEPGDVAAPVGA